MAWPRGAPSCCVVSCRVFARAADVVSIHTPVVYVFYRTLLIFMEEMFLVISLGVATSIP